ncbi:alpha/beta fold hydrolase [Nostoc sp. CMAA1605]|uniref:alpha/beta fold hydrolase n=1 Tax=Nostoc sp. CMAA1605 TaxID=2055159 RepID=UPI001F2DE972|nr:alpha/beta hydrolase [Nostoc sp. CMAA1605]MCF4968544.1 alpha/beta hydrolase [Nostoc sp. CMAA1605]
MPKVSLNGIELFYDSKGTGEPLLLISGFLCDHTYWSVTMPDLTARYQIIRIDNRGIGRSSAPDNPYGLQQLAHDAAALLEHLNIDQVHVAGHSMGGQIAQELALLYPQKVKSLILLSSLAKGDERFNQIISTWGELLQRIDTKLYQQVVLPWIFSDNFYSVPDMIEQLIEWAVHYPFSPPVHSIYHHSRAILGADTINRLQNILCPTLILVGKQDILTPIKFSQQLATGIPQARLSVIEGGGHGFIIESPRIVAKEMLDFLAQPNSKR